jgi:transcriptional regulator with XRE-family HTH domain
MIDTEALSRDLVRALRGHRSQRALSKRLRYESNVVYLWESGRRFPSPASFFWLCHRTGVDIHAVLGAILPERRDQLDEDPWTVTGAAAWLKALKGRRTAAELARQVGVSRHSMARWFRGETEPRLPDLLRLIDICTTRLLDFAALLVDPAELPSVAERWGRIRAARTLVREAPWAPAVMVALELDDYRRMRGHRKGWVAQRIRIPVDEEVRCLALMAEAGQIVQHDGKWETVPMDAVDTRLPRRKQDLKRWWGEVALDRINADKESIHSWNLFTISREEQAQIKELQRQYYRAVREIAANSTKAERVMVLSLHQVALDGERKPPPAPAPESATS